MHKKLTRIFVGRHNELLDMDVLWADTLKEGEHFAYVYFNAPGIGKTTLLRKFGEILEREGELHSHSSVPMSSTAESY